MTVITVPAISLTEAAHLLRLELGPLRNWTTFLTDCIRGAQDLYGLTLLPCARRQDGRGLRPVYAVWDVKAFITDARRVAVCSAGEPIRPTLITVDTGKHWRLNKLDKCGIPLSYPHLGVPHTST